MLTVFVNRIVLSDSEVSEIALFGSMVTHSLYTPMGAFVGTHIVFAWNEEGDPMASTRPVLLPEKMLLLSEQLSSGESDHWTTTPLTVEVDRVTAWILAELNSPALKQSPRPFSV